MLSCRSSVVQYFSSPPKLLRGKHLINYHTRRRLIVIHKHLLSSASLAHHDSDIHDSTVDEHSTNIVPKGWKIRGRLSEDLFHLSHPQDEQIDASYSLRQAMDEEQIYTINDSKGPLEHQSLGHLAPTAAAATLPDLLETNIPLQSKETAELLFDGIAPHLTRRHLSRLQALLKKFDSTSHHDNKKNNSGTCLISKINESFKSDTPWIRPLISNFLVGRNLGGVTYCSKKKAIMQNTPYLKQQNNHADAHNVTGVQYHHRHQYFDDFNKTLDEIWSDPVFPPNSNRLTWNRDVEILMRSQQKSSMGPPLWCNPVVDLPVIGGEDKKTATSITIIDEGTILQNRAAALEIHQAKTDTVKRSEAEEIATLLADRLPRSRHEKLMNLLAKWAPPLNLQDAPEESIFLDHAVQNTNSCTTKLPTPIGTRMKFLEPKLNHTLDLHFPLVALDLAKFLYVYVPPSVIGNHESHNNSIATMGNNGQVGSTKEYEQDGDTRLGKAWKEWNILRCSFVERLLDCQLAYSQRLASPMKPKRTKRDICHDVIPKLTLLRETVGVLSAVTMSGQTADYVNVNDRLRSLQRSHCVFDALVLHEDLFRIAKEKYRSYENRLVFIKNLPIDTTEHELREIYGRCGPIEAIQIFNLRPDLDPGKPSLKEVLNRRQKNRRTLKREETTTPVYARILFRDEEGYSIATNDNLVIFGVVIRKHPCRTVMKNQMKSLFLENLAPGQFSMDIEYKISKALHPDIYVCLNVGYHDFTGIATCEIKFPSHEAASYAYDRLQEIDELGAQIHWLRTPSNAHLHWTREISYDYS